jgi:hypothetical protein
MDELVTLFFESFFDETKISEYNKCLLEELKMTLNKKEKIEDELFTSTNTLETLPTNLKKRKCENISSFLENTPPPVYVKN